MASRHPPHPPELRCWADAHRVEYANYSRDELLRTKAWASHLHPSPDEYIERARFYIETLEAFVSVQEHEEVSLVQSSPQPRR